MSYYSIHYSVQGDTLSPNGNWHRKKLSACIKARDPEHLEKLVEEYKKNLEFYHSGFDLQFHGITEVTR